MSLLTAILALGTGESADAAFAINISFNGDAQFQTAFTNAKNVWESYFSGYQNGVVANSMNSGIAMGQSITGLQIDAEITALDGAGGILGQAGFSRHAVDQAGYRLATEGTMIFDLADAQNNLNNGTFENIVLHEMAHVMGFGTLWELKKPRYARRTHDWLVEPEFFYQRTDDCVVRRHRLRTSHRCPRA